MLPNDNFIRIWTVENLIESKIEKKAREGSRIIMFYETVKLFSPWYFMRDSDGLNNTVCAESFIF